MSNDAVLSAERFELKNTKNLQTKKMTHCQSVA